MNKYYEIKTKIFSGDINQCDDLKLLINKNAGIICDKNVFQNSIKIQNFIKKLSGDYIISYFDYDYKFEPSYQYLDSLMSKIRSSENFKDIECWIGIGGGSAMDTAKAVAFLSNNEGPSINFRGFPKNKNTPLPVVAVPTTTGTGSEVVFNASFIDEESKVKMGINDTNNYPKLSILDPELVCDAPINVLASSGTDALVHTLEAFTSPEADHVTKTYSKKAFHLIMENMPIILNNNGDIKNWSNMQWAAVFAMFGLSINDTSGPAGAFSYYLGTNFNVPHGVAGGSFIGKVCRLNQSKGYFDYSELLGWDGAKNLTDLSKESQSEYVVSSVEKLLDRAKMPKSLSEVGVLKEDLNGFKIFFHEAKAAFDFNPISFDDKDIDYLLT